MNCFTPMVTEPPGAPPSERVLDAHRSIRYDALLELIDQIQRRRSIDELAKVVASRWKHCANVNQWRLLSVYGAHCALVIAEGNQSRVQQIPLQQLPAYDAALWQRRIPRHLDPAALALERDTLPAELAVPQGLVLSVWPIQQGVVTIGMLSVLGFDKPFDALDRKFIQLVAGAMATRIVAILTEQTLQAELLQVERQVMEQRQASILGRLVNGVAHELNTPLGVQISACGALESLLVEPSADAAQDTQDIQDTVQLLAQQARRAAKIVQRLKQISAAAQANPKLSTPLRDEITLIAQSHPALDIAIDCDPDITLQLDRLALATVLGELLDNVRAHSPQADGIPEASIQVLRQEGALRLRVIDHGPGIEARQAALLFEPFHTSKQSQGFMGIGGYIVHNVAKEALHARVELETGPGGTCVTLYLPLPPHPGK